MKRNFDIPEELRIKMGNIIKAKREEKNLGLNQLAVKSGINIADLHKIENGTKNKINPFQLKLLGDALKVDYKEFYKIVGFLDEEDFKNDSLESNVKRIIPIDDVNFVEIPVYGRASAGSGYINLDQVIRTTTISLVDGAKIPEGTFSVEVHGDSMYPTFLEGDLVIVDPACDIFMNNRVYIVTYNEETFIKRVVDHGKYLQLISDNIDKSKYADIIISKDEEGSSFRCNGKVIRLERRF